MKKIFVIIFMILIGLGLLAASLSFFLRTDNLKRRLSEVRQINQKMQEEIEYLAAERERVAKENDKLHTDAVSYIALNAKLQSEREALQKALGEAEKAARRKESDLQEMKRKSGQIERAIAAEAGAGDSERLLKQREELRQKIDSLENTLKAERGLYHYNLGVAYTKAGLYGQAMEEYDRALEFNPHSPETYYNLGLLHEKIKDDFLKAIFYYRRYLELDPYSEDKEEVENKIKELLSIEAGAR